MYESLHNFGLVELIKPESLGVPGKRVFRLLIDGEPPAAATIWLEKEQLYGLSMAIKKLIESEPWNKDVEEEENSEEILRLEDSESLKASSHEVLEFKVGRLGLAVGPGKEHVTLFFHDEEEDEGDTFSSRGEEEPEDSYEDEIQERPKLQFSLEVAKSEEFINESLELCASGRGVDALSRQALVASGKIDPNQNGHFRH
jgi:hypothetical protein